MNSIYNILVIISIFVIKVIAVFNTKLKLGIDGRKQAFKVLSEQLNPTDKVIWFHCASLGEYEQGLPVFEALRDKYPHHKMILSFFSPSGYVYKKNSPIADMVIYLPWDTPKNAFKFIDITHPELVLFVKYDIWPNYLNQLKKRNIHTILISAVFRKNQIYFKWYGSLFKKALFGFSYIFTQNKESKHYLDNIGYSTTTVAGDTRFDRVFNQIQSTNSVGFIEDFIDNKPCVVFGSTWPEDDVLFMNFINTTTLDIKIIIAPHNIKPSYTKSLLKQIKPSTVSFSKKEGNLKQAKVYILDTIGYLNKVYSYATIAYVGGGAGSTGLHNILEPAVFGIPILIGKHYHKFPEAKALLQAKGIISVTDAKTMCHTLENIIFNKKLLHNMGAINKSYIIENKGGSQKILNYICNLNLNIN